MKNIAMVFSGMLLVSVLGACGKKADVTIASAPPASGQFAVRLAADTSTPITEFKLCVRAVKLEGTDGQPVKPDASEVDDQDQDAIKFAPGLIDALTATSWGNVTLPTGFKVSELRIKIHKDDALCNNLGGSMKINGMLVQPDIEFKFKFATPIDVDSTTKQLSVSFDKVVAAIKAAYTNIQASPDSIKSVIEGADGDVESK